MIKLVGMLEYRGVVGLQRLSDYAVFLSTGKHGDCLSEYGHTRKNSGLLRCRTTDYTTCIGVGMTCTWGGGGGGLIQHHMQFLCSIIT